MVASPLVEPLVAPLVGRRTRGSALRRSRLARTALAVSALVAVAGGAEAAELSKALEPAPTPAPRQSEARPSPRISLPVVVKANTLTVKAFLVLPGREELPPPSEAPAFERDALTESRARHGHDPTVGRSPGLRLGQLLDRLFGSVDSTYLRFGSGQHQSALPTH